MSDELTEQELAEIEARANKATTGPWYDHNVDDDLCMNAWCVSTSPREPEMGVLSTQEDYGAVVAITLLQAPRLACVADRKWDNNAEFIAHARTDIPRLIAEVRDLRKQLDDLLESAMERWDDDD